MQDESATNETKPQAPLRIHLSVLIMALLVGVALPLIWLGYRQGKEEALAAAAQRMHLLAERTAERYRGVFGDALAAIGIGAIAESMAKPPPADLEYKTAFAVRALNASEYLEAIFAGYGDGSLIQAVNFAHNEKWAKALGAPPAARLALRVIAVDAARERQSQWRFLDAAGHMVGELTPMPARYDPRGKPWYKRALKAEGPIAWGPYVMAMSGRLGFAFGERHQTNRQAVAGADILLETIRGFLLAEKVSENAKSYVFDVEGALVIHSDETAGELALLESGKGAEFRRRMAVSPDPLLARARALATTREGEDNSLIQFSEGGSAFIAHVAPIRFSTLHDEHILVVTAPLADFTAAADRLLLHGLMVSAALLAVGLLLAMAASGLITCSLQALTAEAVHLGDLDFAEGPRMVSRIKEINTLAGALSSARDAIRTFALYVPRELVRKIVASGQFAGRGALREEVTVLFTDIKDFTTISERHSPEEVVHGLSLYFDLMNKGVEENAGSIVQFLGDSVYAMWNAPVPDADHAARGCRCALDLAGAVVAFNRARREAGLPEFATRFGLHTGPAVVGSVGAETRLQYTAMGDTVNVASRLEGINKEFGTTILVSGAVEARCRGRFHFRALGKRKAKGREEEIEIFELVGTSPSGAGAPPPP